LDIYLIFCCYHFSWASTSCSALS